MNPILFTLGLLVAIVVICVVLVVFLWIWERRPISKRERERMIRDFEKLRKRILDSPSFPPKDKNSR